MRGIVTSSTARSTSSARRALDRLRAVAGLGDDLEVGRRVEHHAQALAHHLVVVREQDARLQRDRHWSLPQRDPEPYLGAARRQRAIAKRPPTSSARSRIPAIPAVPPGSPRGIPSAVVADAERTVSRRPPARRSPSGRSGVTQGVREALLGDPVDDQLDFRAGSRRERALELAPDHRPVGRA